MPRMNKIEKGATVGDSRHPSDGSPVGRAKRQPAPPYPKGLGDSRARASDAGQTPLGSKHFERATDKITKHQH